MGDASACVPPPRESARARAPELAAGEGTCELPAKPQQGQVPGVVLRYGIADDDDSAQRARRRLDRYRRIHDAYRKQGVRLRRTA